MLSLRQLVATALLAGLPVMAVAQPAPQPASAQELPIDPASLALAREILEITNPPGERDQLVMERMRASLQRMTATLGNTPGTAEAKTKVIAERAKITELIAPMLGRYLPPYYEAMARAYTRKFSKEELGQIRDFALTPTGRRFVSIGTTIYRDPEVMAASQRMMDGLVADLLAALKAEQPTKPH